MIHSTNFYKLPQFLNVAIYTWNSVEWDGFQYRHSTKKKLKFKIFIFDFLKTTDASFGYAIGGSDF